jgi:hypothetical protein
VHVADILLAVGVASPCHAQATELAQGVGYVAVSRVWGSKRLTLCMWRWVGTSAYEPVVGAANLTAGTHLCVRALNRRV